MQNAIEKPNSEIVVDTLQPGELVQLQQGFFKGQNATIEYISNQKAHLFLPSLGIKLVINRTSL
jgi:transcription antitermination factor NusG